MGLLLLHTDRQIRRKTSKPLALEVWTRSHLLFFKFQTTEICIQSTPTRKKACTTQLSSIKALFWTQSDLAIEMISLKKLFQHQERPTCLTEEHFKDCANPRCDGQYVGYNKHKLCFLCENAPREWECDLCEQKNSILSDTCVCNRKRFK